MKSNQNFSYFCSISEFKFAPSGLLGQGSSGQVKLATHIRTNKLYAIKIIDCKEIETDISVKALHQQVMISTSINHPHIVKVWQALSDASNIYLIMEHVENGSLFYYQNRRQRFSEQEALKFFTQTLSALQYLHSLNLIHRDLKPQNLLLDKDLNIKLCDLGWITSFNKEAHVTFCGTYQYMAPQMIFQETYDHRVDLWALGILLFLMLHGYAPFQGDQMQKVKKQMKKGIIKIDPTLSFHVQDLIIQILKVDPQERMSLFEIKFHPWVVQRKDKNQNSQLSPKPRLIKNKNKSLDYFQLKNYAQITTSASKSQKKKTPFLSKSKNNLDTKRTKHRQSTQQKIAEAHNSSKQLFTKYKKNPKHKTLDSYKQQRLKTELCSNSTTKFQHFRTNTQYNHLQHQADDRSTIKKKKPNSKKISTQLYVQSKLRKSIDL